jgi:S-adenosylmethionine/arginine decarboxylase-like enzyme
VKFNLSALEAQQEFDFNKFSNDYADSGYWGISTSIDLQQCNHDFIRSPIKLQEYIYELCDLIAMKRFGEPIIVFFGEKAEIAGYSLSQLIETSLISGHFADHTNSAFIDIFSCKIYNPIVAATFTKNFFTAINCNISITFRGF